jgi:hypothetical protein
MNALRLPTHTFNKPRVIGAFLFLLLIIFSPTPAACEARTDVQIMIFVRSVEKVDLSESTFKMDFYLVFEYDPSKISEEEIKQFEFVNGEPSIRIVDMNYNSASSAEITYRVRGDFVSSFELGRYPFDSHNIEVIVEFPFFSEPIDIEHSSLDNEGIIIVGWENEGIETRAEDYSYDGENFFSRFIVSIKIRRPLLSSILKNILPITVISSIALLTFLISPNNPSERIGLGVSTLLSATAFHLSLLGGIPPTGEFTIADGIMLSVYLLHFYSLLISVYLMRLKEREDLVRAENINKKAIIFLPLIIVLPIALAILINI